MEVKKIQQRIDEIRAEMAKFVADAEKQLAAYNGAIQALESLLDDGTGDDVDEQEVDDD